MKKAKFLALCLLTLALVALLASCGGEKSPVGPDGTTAPDVTGTPDNPVEELPKLENLKINGTLVSEYKIVVKGTTYGAKYASELLQKKILALTGHELSIVSGASGSVFYIDSVNSADGKYHIDVDGSSITLYGTGHSGAFTAVNGLIDEIDDGEDATVESKTAPMFTLENTKKKLEEGKLSIGVLGDSMMDPNTGYRALCEFFLDSLKAEYPNADIQMKNHSKGGMNTYWGLYQIEDALLSEGYDDLIIIGLGGNDLPYGSGYDETALNYQAIIEKIRKANPEAEIVVVMYGTDSAIKDMANGYEISDKKARFDVTEYYKVPIVDTNLEMYSICSAGNYEEIWRKYIYDSVHANNAGQELYGGILWRSVKAALDGSEGKEAIDCYMPKTPLFENSKVNAVKLPWDSIKDQIIFGTGEESGWTSKGRTTKTGSSISYEFEGIGLELGIGKNEANPYMLLIQIYDENGELVLEQERETFYYYHLFITNELEYGKYTAKLTVTRPSEKYPSERPSFTLTDLAIIK